MVLLGIDIERFLIILFPSFYLLLLFMSFFQFDELVVILIVDILIIE
jgi:hypothetical protein